MNMVAPLPAVFQDFIFSSCEFNPAEIAEMRTMLLRIICLCVFFRSFFIVPYLLQRISVIAISRKISCCLVKREEFTDLLISVFKERVLLIFCHLTVLFHKLFIVALDIKAAGLGLPACAPADPAFPASPLLFRASALLSQASALPPPASAVPLPASAVPLPASALPLPASALPLRLWLFRFRFWLFRFRLRLSSEYGFYLLQDPAEKAFLLHAFLRRRRKFRLKLFLGASSSGFSAILRRCHVRNSVMISKYRSRFRSTDAVRPRSISLSSMI